MKRLLVSILCIDERHKELERCLISLRNDPTPKDYLGVFREKDENCKKLIPNHLCVENYVISKGSRHNMDFMVKKRTLAIEYAFKNKYDLLWFVDSDIIIEPIITVNYLLSGIENADICIVPYPIRWTDMFPVVAYVTNEIVKIEPIRKSGTAFHECVAGGMGCTMLNLKSSKLPRKFTYGVMLGIEGEDIGFFIEAFKNQCKVLIASWHVVEHITLSPDC
jgi:hypothetical protein